MWRSASNTLLVNQHSFLLKGVTIISSNFTFNTGQKTGIPSKREIKGDSVRQPAITIGTLEMGQLSIQHDNECSGPRSRSFVNTKP